MAPFLDDGAVFQQQQSRIAAYHGLQRCLVCDIEGIFCSRDVLPVPDGFLRTCREAEEGISMVVGVFVYLVDASEVAVIGKVEMWRDEQEGVALAVNHFLGDIFARLRILYAEVVDRGHVAFFCLHRLAVDEGPGRVWIIVYRKLLPLAVLLQNEGGIKLRLLGSLRNLHTLGDVGTDVIRAEVELRQIPQAPDAHHDGEEEGVVDHYPLCLFRDEPRHLQRLSPKQDGENQEDDVLDECLHIGEHYGVTEASAILYWVCDDDPECNQRHHAHHGKGDFAHQSPSDGEEEEDTDGKLSSGKQYRHHQGAPVGKHPVDMQRFQIVGYLVLCAQWIHSLHES